MADILSAMKALSDKVLSIEEALSDKKGANDSESLGSPPLKRRRVDTFESISLPHGVRYRRPRRRELEEEGPTDKQEEENFFLELESEYDQKLEKRPPV